MRAGVQTARNRIVCVCETGEHGERGSGKYKLTPWVTRKRTLRDREAGSEKRVTCTDMSTLRRAVGEVGSETPGS
jgi:hypothetical protein